MAALIEEKENTNVSATPSFNNPVPSNTPVPTTETISSASLKAQPQVKFPETKPNIQMTAAESLVKGTGDSMINQLRAETAAKTEAAKGNYNNSLDQYIAQLGNQKGFSGFLAEEEKKAGIQALASEAAELEGQINSERLSRAELRTRLDQKGGGLKSGADAEFQNFARDSLFRETNAVIQLGVRSGQLAAAKATAQRVAEAYYEQEQNALSARKELVDLNKELFDKEEQRSFNLQYESAVRELKKQEEELKLTQMTKIDALKMLQLNGDPKGVSVDVQNAQTVEEVIRAAGTAGVADLLSREQLRASIANSWSSYNLNALKIKGEQDKQKQIQEAIKNGEIVLDDSQKDMAFKIAKEYENESAEFKKQVSAYNRILASGTEPSAAGDLALIFNYMKLLDPGSTVREGEFATAQNAASVPERIRAQYQSVLKGEKLTESTRADFLDRSQKLYNSSLDQQIELENRYRDQAVNVFGLPENAADTVIQDIRAAGTVSNIGFGVQINNLSVDQMAELVGQGLLPTNKGLPAQ